MLNNFYKFFTVFSPCCFTLRGFICPVNRYQNCCRGDYATIAAAIADLNTQGVGAGGVTLNLIADNAETAPAGGYVIGGTGSLVLTTTNATDQVIIQGNGNSITANGHSRW